MEKRFRDITVTFTFTLPLHLPLHYRYIAQDEGVHPLHCRYTTVTISLHYRYKVEERFRYMTVK